MYLNKSLVVFLSYFFLYDDKSYSIINFYSRKLKVYFSKDSCATGNDLSKEYSEYFLQRKVICNIMIKKVLEETFLWPSSPIIYLQDCDFPWDVCIKITSFSCLLIIPSFFLTYDLHLLTFISVLVGIRLANKGVGKVHLSN